MGTKQENPRSTLIKKEGSGRQRDYFIMQPTSPPLAGGDTANLEGGEERSELWP